MKTSQQIREGFIKFWNESPRNAATVPNASLVPNNDSTLLFVNSGMFPLAPYLGGQQHPLGKRLVNVQRCLRTKYDEMIEIGDNRHTLMFEMLGDWSLGDFTKEQQIPWILEFLVKVVELNPKNLYVSVFGGDDTAPRDTVAIETWKKAFATYGIDAEFSEDITNIPKDNIEGQTWKYRIFPYPKKKNWWQRADAPGELGGPSSEIFYDTSDVQHTQEKYHINDDSGRFIEIGNNVFMEYKLDDNMKWVPLEQKNIDFGGGLERLAFIAQGKSDIYESDIYASVIAEIEKISGKEYKTNEKDNEWTAPMRVIADHSRAATFIIADGVMPSNKDQGYILRRFIRRLVRFGKKLGIERDFTAEIAAKVVEALSPIYPHLNENKELGAILTKEEKIFKQTLTKGLKELETFRSKRDSFTGQNAFYIYETFGFPLELTLDELGFDEDTANKISEQFKEAEAAHRAKSKAGAEQKFKGGLADSSKETTKLHTAHHLLLKALQMVVGGHVHQKGSNITAERLRLDFSHNAKLTPEQITEVEQIVNEQIKAELPVTQEFLPKTEAEKIGAEMEFGQKYPDTVSVFFIGKNGSNYFSAEFCGGPHVKNTKEIGEGNKTFKIFKEEASGNGIRRIKAGLV